MSPYRVPCPPPLYDEEYRVRFPALVSTAWIVWRMRTVACGAAIGILTWVFACTAPTQAAKPAAYGAELAACTEVSKTLAESIDCENHVRARYGRPPRDAGGE